MKAVGVDLGGSNARAALVDTAAGTILAEAKRAWEVQGPSPEVVTDVVGAVIGEVDPGHERVGVGVGFAGMLRGFTGVVANSPNFGWRDVDLRSRLRARIGERLELYNDLNAIAFGEATYGSARGIADIVCVYVGTGVGAGIVTDGRLYAGANHLAGEIGHAKVVVDGGRPCGCGMRGCLEAYASGRHLALRAQEELVDQHSLAVELAGGRHNVHAGFLDEAARRGDAYADRLWNEVSSLLGFALANLVTTLNPARLVMGGGVWQGAPELGRRSVEKLFAMVNQPSAEGFRVIDTALGDNAGVLGAAALIARTLT